MQRNLLVIAAFVLLGLWLWSGLQPSPRDAGAPMARDARAEAALPATAPTAGLPDFLPVQARDVLADIARGGPYDYRQDGGVFQNRERLLPPQPRGYYREYTVPTPGAGDRGPRRIVTGGQPPTEYWYTDDHYRSFRRFEVSR